jgi:hypothetical protein
MSTTTRTRKHSDILVTFFTGVKITGDYIDDPLTVLCALPLLSLARSVARSHFHVFSIELFLPWFFSLNFNVSIVFCTHQNTIKLIIISFSFSLHEQHCRLQGNIFVQALYCLILWPQSRCVWERMSGRCEIMRVCVHGCLCVLFLRCCAAADYAPKDIIEFWHKNMLVGVILWAGCSSDLPKWQPKWRWKFFPMNF